VREEEDWVLAEKKLEEGDGPAGEWVVAEALSPREREI
jgi:hypothetical protein